MSVLAALERLLLPNACVACERLVDGPDPDALVCTRCRWRLKPLLGGCARCRQPLPPIGACRFCQAWPTSLEWAWSGVWLGAEAREIVHHLKYEGYVPLATIMADVVARSVPPPPGGVLVPVPLSQARRARRGFNQATLLAQALAPRWGLAVRERLLTREGDAGSQTALTPEERLANVAGAFRATPAPHTTAQASDAGPGADGTSAASGPRSPAGGGGTDALVIVDDVLTTGATLCAAATALGAAGWRHLGAVTFARALPFDRRVS